VDHAEVVDDEVGPRHLALELVVVVEGVHLLRAAADQNKAGEIAAVRVEQARLEALDAAILLQLAVVPDALVEDLDGTLLAPTHHLAPADEETGVGHEEPPCGGLLSSVSNLRPGPGRGKLPSVSAAERLPPLDRAPRTAAQVPSARAITICCTSSVPSPIVRILASR
jgi:hypothetical protein